MKQLKVGLTDAQRAHLETVASIGGHSLSEEIRRRLDRSIGEDQFDFMSREIGNDVMWIASMLLQKIGWGPRLATTWDNDPRMHEALSIAITAWLEAKKPVPRPDSGAGDDLFDPKTLGLAAANNYAMLKAERQRLGADLVEFLDNAAMQSKHMMTTKKKGKP
jgi:hypothetical protein